MTIFAVMATRNAKAIGDGIARAFPNDHLKISDHAWLISAATTTQDVSTKIGLGPSPEPSGSGVVVSIGSYYGRASPEIWDWIRSKWTDGPHG